MSWTYEQGDRDFVSKERYFVTMNEKSESYAFGLASCGKVLVSLENTSSASLLHRRKTKTSAQNTFKIFPSDRPF
jgi:hypothetical protein